VELNDPQLHEEARRLTAWDGSLGVDSTGGVLYEAWLKELKSAMLALHVPKELHKVCSEVIPLPAMLKALIDADPRWFGGHAKAARDRLVRETFAAAVGQARRLPRRWGALHTVT